VVPFFGVTSRQNANPHFSRGWTRKSHREKLGVEKRPLFGHNCVV
jgi:hypothetical protein